jgi:hypothetical protein
MYWYVIALWQLFLMCRHWGLSTVLAARFAKHSGKSKWAILWPFISSLIVPTQTATASTRWQNFRWNYSTRANCKWVLKLYFKLSANCSTAQYSPLANVLYTICMWAMKETYFVPHMPIQTCFITVDVAWRNCWAGL